jgi:hypothetical protein
MEFAKEVFPDTLKKGGLFLDAGSGVGKATLIAGLLFPFKKCVGIEYLEKIDLVGVKALQRFNIQNEILRDNTLFKDHVIKENDSVSYIFPEFQLISGDFLDHNWNQYDMIFCSCTSFSDNLMNSISKKSLEMKPGAILITVSKRAPEAKKIRWRLFDGFRRMMSWGTATVYFHQVRPIKVKKTENKTEKDNESSIFAFK